MALTTMRSSVIVPLWLSRNAMSAASRPVAMRTSDCRGASNVPSTTRHWPSTNASPTAWKSIGYRPGAYTDTTRAGTFTARSIATTRWA